MGGLSSPMKSSLFVGLLLGLAACGRSASEAQVQALKTTQSWIATAQMVGEIWQQGFVPDHYAQQTLARSQAEIAKQTQDLTDPPALLQQVHQIQQTLQTMTEAVERHDRTTIAPILQQLLGEQQQLSAFGSQQEQPQQEQQP